MSATLRAASATPVMNGDRDEVVLSPDGYKMLEEEHRRPTTAKRLEVASRLEALHVPGELADNPEEVDARVELDRVEDRIVPLERRLHEAGVLRRDEASSQVVCLGSSVTLDDVDDGLREEYVLVFSAESNPAEGRLSVDSPVGKAILGHRCGDLVDAQAPHRIRHMRITELGAGTRNR